MEISCEKCLHNGVCFRQEVTNNINDWIDEHGCEYYKSCCDYKLVVKCKDCVYYNIVAFCGNDMHYGYCANCHDDVVGTRNRFELDFCSYGKRKEK